MPASIDDILTAAKNWVTALNNNTQTYLNVNGIVSVSGMTSATLVKSSAGRVCNVIVVVGGSAVGKVYDVSTVAGTSNPVFTIPTTAGVYPVNCPTNNGIVVAPGTGQTISVSYS